MKSSIYEALNEKKQQIIFQWQSAAFDAYGCNIALLRQKPDGRFSNPIVYALEKTTHEIVNLLIKSSNIDEFAGPLDEVCRLMAIQGSKPSQALGFIFALKQIIKVQLRDENGANYWAAELGEINNFIDQMGLLAFDIYSECRAGIYEIKVSEIKRMYGRDAG
jgi:hypothetical protein